MLYRARRFDLCCAVVIGVVGSFAARPVSAQTEATLLMPTPVVERIAADVQAGRRTFYCYHGFVTGAHAPSVQVDSVTIVSVPDECQGVGIGFVSPISDRAVLGDALTKLIRAHASWHVVSAFYGTELVELEGRQVRAARAFSVMRGVLRTVDTRS
jgi:hypothetical protein